MPPSQDIRRLPLGVSSASSPFSLNPQLPPGPCNLNEVFLHVSHSFLQLPCHYVARLWTITVPNLWTHLFNVCLLLMRESPHLFCFRAMHPESRAHPVTGTAPSCLSHVPGAGLSRGQRWLPAGQPRFRPKGPPVQQSGAVVPLD